MARFHNDFFDLAPDQKSLTFIRSSCTGTLCSNLPQLGDVFKLKSLLTGNVYNATTWSSDELYFYPLLTAKHLEVELAQDAEWCIVEYYRRKPYSTAWLYEIVIFK